MNNPNEIADKIKIAANKNGITVKQMLIDTGLGANTLQHMKTSVPKADTLAKIADYLGVSVDYLLGREIKNAPDEDVRSDMINRIMNLSESDAEKLRILVETVFPEEE